MYFSFCNCISILWIFSSYDLLFLEYPLISSPDGKKISKYLESLGPIFIKFGQLLSTRTDILDIATAKDLQGLTDSCKPFSVKKLKEIVEKQLGGPIDQIFKYFDEVPLAAASLAQVHSAKLPDGREVVIKVLRPNIEKEVKKNLRLLKAAATPILRLGFFSLSLLSLPI